MDLRPFFKSLADQIRSCGCLGLLAAIFAGTVVIIALAIILTGGNDDGSDDTARAIATPTPTPARTVEATNSPVATPSSTPQTATPPSIEPALAGPWALTVDPSAAGPCNDDPPYTELVTIRLIDGGPGLGVTGIEGAVNEPWEGSARGPDLTFGGDKTDGIGKTSATFTLSYDAATDTLSGDEAWSWYGDVTCEGGTSTVEGSRP